VDHCHDLKKRKTVVVKKRVSNRGVNSCFLSEGSLVTVSVEEGDLEKELGRKADEEGEDRLTL